MTLITGFSWELMSVKKPGRHLPFRLCVSLLYGWSSVVCKGKPMSAYCFCSKIVSSGLPRYCSHKKTNIAKSWQKKKHFVLQNLQNRLIYYIDQSWQNWVKIFDLPLFKPCFQKAYCLVLKHPCFDWEHVLCCRIIPLEEIRMSVYTGVGEGSCCPSTYCLGCRRQRAGWPTAAYSPYCAYVSGV